MISNDFPQEKQSYKIVLTASGTRGDVQPYIALGLGLKSKGHAVIIATEERLRPLVEEFGLRYARLGGDPAGLLFEPSVQKVLKDGSMFKLIKMTEERDKKRDMKDILDSYFSACSGAEIIISSGLTLTQSYTVAEYFNATWIPMILGPTLPTTEFPLWALESLTPFSCMNKWSYNIAFSALWNSESKFINPWRQSLGLEPIKEKKGIADLLDKLRAPVLVCFSPIACPNRRIPGDYPSYAHMLGFIFVKPLIAIEHDSKLVQFISNDPQRKSLGKTRPIIYLGFGSMPAPNGPKELLEIAIDTCAKLNCRAVLVLGWTNIDIQGKECDALMTQSSIRETLCVVQNSVSHEWLFPQMDCLIHHCGVGTMAAALRAGRPQVPCPFMLDQPYNSRIVVRLGCAPAVVKFDRYFSASKLSQEVGKVLTGSNGDKYRQRAAEVGLAITRESIGAVDSYCEIISKEHAMRMKKFVKTHVPNPIHAVGAAPLNP